MSENEFVLFSAILILLLAVATLYGMLRINKKLNNESITRLYPIPIAWIILYCLIIGFSPTIETARTWLRLTVMFSFGDALQVIYAYSKMLFKRGKL